MDFEAYPLVWNFMIWLCFSTQQRACVFRVWIAEVHILSSSEAQVYLRGVADVKLIRKYAIISLREGGLSRTRGKQ